MIAVNLVLYAVAFFLAVPCVVFSVECLAALVPKREPSDDAEPGSGRIALVVAAHDETAVIAETLAGLLPELGPEDLLLVVADNCTDDTAAIARRAGATVAERHDPERRGKGYALEFAFNILEKDPPAAVVIVDADCQVSAGSVRHLANFALAHRRPVQADNLFVAQTRLSPLAAISVLAFLVRNRVRPTGLRKLGLPCHLMGTGMAFPWDILRMAPPGGSSLTEDLLMGVELAALGFPPIYCASAHVTSLPPDRTAVARVQRRRWEHGHLAVLLGHAPQMILRGIGRRNLALAAMGFDLLVPPLALLLSLVALACAGAWVGVRFGAAVAPLGVLLGSLGLVAVAVAAAWLKHGRAVLPARYLLLAPIYVLWKIPLYISFVLHGAYRNWERTEHKAKGRPQS